MNVLFLSGDSAESVVVEALKEVGIDASDHVPRQLDRSTRFV